MIPVRIELERRARSARGAAGRFRRAAVVAGLVLASFAMSAAAARPQTPQFRTATTAVPLDIRVVDQRGQPVVGLTQADFSVFEDGVRQSILQFVGHTLTPEPPSGTPAVPLERERSGTAPAPANRRVFLLVLGRGRLQEPSKGLDGLMYFVRDRLLPQDLVAVMAWNRATEFTTDRERIVSLLERFKATHQSIEARLTSRTSGLAGVYGTRTIPSAIQGEIDAVFGRLASGRSISGTGQGDSVAQADRRKTLDRIARAESDDMRSRDRSLTATPLMSDLPFEDYVAHDVQTMHDLEKVHAAISYLRFVKGEKHLVLITEHGLFLPRLEEQSSLAADANDARVVIDTIQTGGVPAALNTGSDAGSSLDLLSGRHAFDERQLVIERAGKGFEYVFATNDLRTISTLTGGRSSISEYTRNAVERIDSLSRTGYLIGYQSTNPKMDGTYRRLNVQVNRKGVTVLFRHGYYASETPAPPDREAFVTYTRIVSAASAPGDVPDIGLEATGRIGRMADGSTQVAIDARVDLAKVLLAEDGGKRSGTLQMAVFCFDRAGRLVGERWQRVDLKLNQPTYDQLRQQGMPYVISVAVTASASLARVIAYDPNTDLVGSAEVTLRQ